MCVVECVTGGGEGERLRKRVEERLGVVVVVVGEWVVRWVVVVVWVGAGVEREKSGMVAVGIVDGEA